jgi:4-amino-4-deoxy-L-arabinose transferase-like glycosyltransferase
MSYEDEYASSTIPSIKIEFKNKYIYLILLFFVATVCLFSNLWIGDLGLDSCVYATISRAILRTGNWVVPHFEHSKEPLGFWQHPPLFFWMTAISYKIFGVNEFAAKFISALLGVFTILTVYLIGYRLSSSHKIGFLSGFVLLTTQQFLDLSRKCQLDVPQAFFIALSILFLILSIQKSEKYCILLGISTGLAFLAKGFPALAIFGIVLLFYILNKDFKFFIRPGFYIFILFFILTLGIWIIPLIQYGEFKNFLDNYFKGQVLFRFLHAQSLKELSFVGKIKGYLWYIIVLLKNYWPWIPFLILSCYLGIKKRKENKMLLIIILWIFIMLIGFSIAGTKYYRYLAPVYPGFAVLIGVVLGKRASEKVFRGILIFSLIFLLVILFATSIFPLYFGKINAPNKTEVKKISPYIQLLTEIREPISVYRLPYSGTLASFAFYVDRSIVKFNQEDKFALSLKEENALGYLDKSDYEKLSGEFKKNFLPLVETENFLLITRVQNYDSFIKKIFPIFIYK